MSFSVLSWIVWLPAIAAVIVLCIPKDKENAIRGVSLGASFLVLLLSLDLVTRFNLNRGFQMLGDYKFIEKIPWIKSIGMQYFLGADGLSVTLLFLTALLGFLCMGWSWHITQQVKLYYFLMLLLMVGMLGVFVALDYVLFYVFWEFVLLPMYFLIGIWGGENRAYASIKFFLYTLAGSVVMLLGILALYFYGPRPLTFDMVKIAEFGAAGGYAKGLANLIFASLFLGFAIKVPIAPFHTWLPDAHVEAPTAGSVLLAGILLKMGAYGFLRVSMMTLPATFRDWSWALAVLGVVSIIYGAALALAQKDMKKMIAYSSVSHMGYVILGIAAMNAAGVNGAILQIFNHGIITGMLFFLVGMVYERAHTKEIAKLGGLAAKTPVLAAIIAFAAFGSLGLPGLSGFVGEFMSLLGGFQKYLVLTGFAVIGIVLTTAFFLRMLRQVVFGEASIDTSHFADVNGRELFALVPLCAFTLAIGLYPMPFLDFVNTYVTGLVQIVGG